MGERLLACFQTHMRGFPGPHKQKKRGRGGPIPKRYDRMTIELSHKSNPSAQVNLRTFAQPGGVA
jgi:hypothetical protein